MVGSKNHKGEDNGNQAEDAYNSEEQHKLRLLRTFVESHDPSAKVVDDLTLRRFLRARDLDVEKAGAMFLKHLKWRKEFVPTGSISEAEIEDELAHNKAFLQGCDKRGCPVIVIIARSHYQSKKPGGLDELKRLVVYGFDKICSRLPVGEEKFIAIIDLQGWGYANSDIRGYLALLSLMQVCPTFFSRIQFVHAFHFVC
ncbi:hypothetical protein Droror1_Dr00021499 [Drosera rotundifolia]